ncbi:MAG: radical SAM protein [Spirochaeta sp.]|nr:radical SAM protein [Spirochaeta sp.]
MSDLVPDAEEARVTPRYFEKLEGKTSTLQCTLCPHLCRFTRDGVGRCGVRGMADGLPWLPFAGQVSARTMDPIEKKPLFHFHPGEKVYSVGFLGCNLHCPFCQNYGISQVVPDSEAVHNAAARNAVTPSRVTAGGSSIAPANLVASANLVAPADLVASARESGSFGIAYTYNEPGIHFEYVLECAELAHQAGLKNILVTAGYLQPEPARELLRYMDAANVDLKGWRTSFYRELGGSLEPVLEFLRIAQELTHLEVTTLLIPGHNDDPSDLHELFSFVAELGPDVPLHISAFHPIPGTEFNAPSTPPEAILAAVEQARAHLHYVYPGNITAPAHTHCPSCTKQVIRRHGYHVSTPGLTNSGNCASCGTKIVVY